MAKIAPWRLARRDNSLAKAPGQVTGRADAANVYSLNRRGVRLSKNLLYLLISMRLVILQKTMCFVA
jgi:hypothetical protein